MKKLSPNWFIEGLLDFEYKKYVLLAYLKEVSNAFAEVQLYPSMVELVHHYQNLAHFQQQNESFWRQLPSRLDTDALLQERQISFRPDVEKPTSMEEIEAIVEFAVPAIKGQLEAGRELYHLIDQKLRIEPVGIVPLYNREGYIFLRLATRSEMDIYRYNIILYENVGENYHGISMTYLDSFRYSPTFTYEYIKRELISQHQDWPNPATYLVFSEQIFPRESALLPVTKRKLLAYLKTASG